MRMTILTKQQVFDLQKPKYNGYTCGHGKFKNKKLYNRKDKTWAQEVW